ncbi:Atp-binding protein [Globisporangium polare]
MASSGWNASRQASYGSVPFEDDDDGFGDDDQPAKRSLFEILFFTRAAPVYDVIQARNLEVNDFFRLEKPNYTQLCTSNLEYQYEKRNQSIWKAIVFAHGRLLVLCGMGQVFMAGYTVFAPVVLHQVVIEFSTTEAQLDLKTLTEWLGVFFGVRLLNAFVTTQVNYTTNQIWLRLSAATRSLVFQKAMRKRIHRSSSSSEKGNPAKPVDTSNLVGSDTTDLVLALTKIPGVLILPLQIGIETLLLLYVLDVAAFAGIGVIILSLLANYFISRKMARSYTKWLTIKDRRMATVKELLNAIQIVKFNAWEDRFKDKLTTERARELRALAWYSYAGAASTFVLWSSPLLVSTVSFAVYALVLEKPLSAAKVFTAMALFNALRDPLRDLPTTIQLLIQSRVAAARFDTFLRMPEFDESSVTRSIDDSDNDNPAVRMIDGQFSWLATSSNEDKAFASLKDVNFRLEKGDFAVVFGGVGAGKSSLCSALLGEMSKVDGQVVVNGRVAYYSQQPWIQNMSLKSNILFGEAFDADRYDAVLDACCLRDDLELFPAGDETEIGERGASLSGGQKARVALARACYAQADIYILDSPLAAVDTVVQKAVFQKCICGLLAEKTVILVTHNREIIVSKLVTYRIGLAGGNLTESERTGQPGSRDIFGHVGNVSRTAAFGISPRAKGSGLLVQEEARQEGRVSSAVWQRYAKAIGGVGVISLLLLSQLLWQGFQIASDFWLGYWTRSKDATQAADTASVESVEFFIDTYAELAGAAAVMVLIQGVVVTSMGLRASKHLFQSMTQGVLHAPLWFFDTNPDGRVINRYGGDMSVVDKSLPKAMGMFLCSLFSSFCALVTAGVSIQWYVGLVFVPIVYAYAQLAQGYARCVCTARRLLKVIFSSVQSHIAQSEAGVVVLRAYGPAYVRRAVRENYRLLDLDNALWDTEIVLVQWFAIRLQLLGCGILGVVVASFFLFHGSPAMVGLVFSYALSIDASLMTLTKAWSDAQNDMVSVERVVEYSALECEGESINNGSLVQIEPSASWPQRGEVTFERVCFSYKPKDPPVLQSISFAIKSHEKVGVVGRTGAGKSSLTMALFRVNELVSGRILIDGVDIATLPLPTLRKRMSIIPQSPVLLEGSLRNFLDPFDEFQDDEILEMLNHVELLSKLQASCELSSSAEQEEEEEGGKESSSQAAVLELQLSANGDNWSVGERQMLSMARALLKRSAIVVMDEATAAMDHETEHKLSAMIARELKNVTLLTIAHRLVTVMASDRIMVLQEGQVVEFGSPSELLATGDGGVFYGLVQEDKHEH